MISYFFPAIHAAPAAGRCVGCHGKLPSQGDFLRRNADLPEAAALDEWIREGILATRVPLERFWDSTYDLAPPARLFFLSPSTGRALCAFALASSDSAGRRYPFLVFRVEAGARCGGSLGRFVPSTEPFLATARDIASLGHVPASRAGFLRRVDALSTRAEAGLREGALDRWLEARTTGDLVGGALGDAFDPRRYLLFTALRAAARTGPEIWRVLRLPPCERAGDLGFWLLLLETLSGGRLDLRMVLWNEPFPGFPPRPVLFRSRIEPPDFQLFLNPGYRDHRVLDVLPPDPAPPVAVEAARGRVGAVLEDPLMPLRELLEALAGGPLKAGIERQRPEDADDGADACRPTRVPAGVTP
jgi:type VI secretion system ImpM family protein